MDIIRVIAAGIPGKENKGWSPLSVWREIQTTGGECLCLSDIDCIQKVEKGGGHSGPYGSKSAPFQKKFHLLY